MGYEDALIAKIDRDRAERMELPSVIVKAHEKAKAEVLSNPDYVIQESEFASVYGEKAVANDIKEADRLEREVFNYSELEKQAKVISETLEAIILMQSEQSEWLGSAQTLKTARYDDYHNKVDMLAEWFSEDGTKFLGLAVDITFGTSKVGKKLAEIREEIDKGRLGSVRYFKDTRGDFMGTRNNVPRTVIGISRDRVAELAALWLNNKQRELGSHPVQALFIEEMDTQLSAMRTYAERLRKPDIVAAYDQALAAIRPLKTEKHQFADASLRNDPVADQIFEETKKQFG